MRYLPSDKHPHLEPFKILLMNAAIPENPSKLADIMRKIRIFARRYYKYPYPEEPFFRDVAEKAIADAHGTAEREIFTKIRIKMLWLFVKVQSLRYVTAVREHLQNHFLPYHQKAYYARKLSTEVDTLDSKIDDLMEQFSDPDDILY